MNLEKIKELINDVNVVSISLCKYERTNKTVECFIDYKILEEEKERQCEISEAIYDSFNVKEEKGESGGNATIYTKTIAKQVIAIGVKDIIQTR
jgi:hypothetical protein